MWPETNTHTYISKKYFSIFGKSLQLLAPDLYMDYIADMICHIFQYSIQQQHYQNFRELF